MNRDALWLVPFYVVVIGGYVLMHIFHVGGLGECLCR